MIRIGHIPAVKEWYKNQIFSENKENRNAAFIRLKNDLTAEYFYETVDDCSIFYDYIILHRLDVHLDKLINLIKINPMLKVIYFITEEPSIVPFHTKYYLSRMNFYAVLGCCTPFKNLYFYTYPNPVLKYTCNSSFNQRKLCCAIATKKRNWFSNSSLYQFRNRFLSRLANNGIDLFGKNWGRKDKSLGPIDDKFKVLGNYRFTIIIENSITDNFVTEKIFDAFSTGTVPVYYGAKNIRNIIPKSTFISLEGLDPLNLMNHLSSISEKKWIAYQKAIQIYLSSPNYLEHTEIQFSSLIQKILNRTDSLIPMNIRQVKIILLESLLKNPNLFLKKYGLKLFKDLILE